MLRLKDAQFADIIFQQDSVILVRYMRGMPSVLCKLPEKYRDDAQRLKECIEHEKQDEFFIIYDEVPYRVAQMHTIMGKCYALRRPFYPIPVIHTLGYKKPVVDVLKKLPQCQGGLLIVSGPTGSGKTTTIYSLLKYYVETYGDVLVALEDPAEAPMQGTYSNASGAWYQVNVNHYGGYAQALKASMRHNPRYILIGEIRDPSVAHWALRAAVNGHIVASTIHGNSVSGAILALMQTAASYSSHDLARSILADGLLGVIHQRITKGSQNAVNLIAEVFFPGNNAGARAKIRSGKLELLGTEISMQNRMVQNNEELKLNMEL